MRLFTIDKNGKMILYKKHDFKELHQEFDLEILLENNPEYFFEDSRIIIIGKQVTTNLNTFIDLLGLDSLGNTVIIELKRDKTPRETLAQLLEYASFVDKLDYSQLNDIFQEYSGEESNLEEYHQQYFKTNTENQVSYNKSTKLIIVAQEISKEVRQTALFLREKGLDIYCASFKYFKTKNEEEIISMEFVVGEEELIRKKIETTSLPKINEIQFLNSLNINGKKIFEKIFSFGKKNNLICKWGSKGFSLNVGINSENVTLLFGYPPNSVFKQSIYTRYEIISKKVNNPEEVFDFYKTQIKSCGYFQNVGSNSKWIIDKPYSEKEINKFLNILEKVIIKIKENGLK
ncbi:MAG: hypothetical protein ABIK21_04910 [bacterium]